MVRKGWLALGVLAFLGPMAAQGQDDACNAMGDLDRLDDALGSLEQTPDHLRADRANEMLDMAGSLRSSLNGQTGSVVLGMNQGVIDDFVKDRSRLLKSVAEGNYESARAEIGSDSFQRQTERLNIVQGAMRCDEDDEEEETEQASGPPKKIKQLQALAANSIGDHDRGPLDIGLLVLLFAALIGAGLLAFGLRYGFRFLRRDARQYHRYFCTIEGTLKSDGASQDATLVEVSRSGAKVAGENMPEAGTPVTLIVPEFSTTGKIIWSNAKYAGLRFDEIITVSLEPFGVTETLEQPVVPADRPAEPAPP